MAQCFDQRILRDVLEHPLRVGQRTVGHHHGQKVRLVSQSLVRRHPPDILSCHFTRDGESRLFRLGGTIETGLDDHGGYLSGC
jgi:hypothetical protein